jgi:hypothetical protein
MICAHDDATDSRSIAASQVAQNPAHGLLDMSPQHIICLTKATFRRPFALHPRETTLNRTDDCAMVLLVAGAASGRITRLHVQ